MELRGQAETQRHTNMRKLYLLLIIAAIPLAAQAPTPVGLGFYPVSDISQCAPFPAPQVSFCPIPQGLAVNSQAAPTQFTVLAPGKDGINGRDGTNGTNGKDGAPGPAFTGGACHILVTGAADAKGIPVQITCP